MPTKLPGKLLSPEFDTQLRRVVRSGQTDERSSDLTRRVMRVQTPSRFRIHAVILDEDLPAGTFLNPIIPQGLNCTRCQWDGFQYRQLEQRLIVWNQGHETHDKDTPGAAIFIDGHYWFFADCAPIENREDPPWMESDTAEGGES